MPGTSSDAANSAAADLEVCDGPVHLRPPGPVGEPDPDQVVDALSGNLPPAAATLAAVCRLDTAGDRAFALLGYFALASLPASVPSCTGARHAGVLGSPTPGRDGWPRWERPPVRPTQLVVDQDRSSR